MNFSYGFEEDGNYHVLRFSKNTSEYDYRQSAINLAKTLGKSEGQKVLIDSREAPVKLNGIHYLDFIRFATTKMPPMTKIAILVHPTREEKARVAPVLASQAKIEMKVFLEPGKALGWLLD